MCPSHAVYLFTSSPLSECITLLPCLGGDADTVFLHVHDGFGHLHRDRVGRKLHVERPLELLRNLVKSIWWRTQADTDLKKIR